MAKWVDSIFKPARVLLVGSSKLWDSEGFYGRYLSNLSRNLGDKATVLDIEKVKEARVPKRIDLLILSIPERLLERTLKVLSSKALRCILIPGEFSPKAEEEIMAFARRRDVTVIGPRAAPGLFCARSKTSALTISTPPHGEGPMSVVCQDSSWGHEMLRISLRRRMSIGKFICAGRSSPNVLMDILEHLAGDQETGAICLQLSEIEGGRELLELLRRAAAAKPVIMLYTGAEDPIVSSAIKQIGAVAVKSAESLLVAGAFLPFMPRMSGNRVAVLTNAPEITEAIDTCLKRAGLAMVPPSPDTCNKILKRLAIGKSGALEIPQVSDGEALKRAVKDVVHDRGVDAVMIVLDPEMPPVIPENVFGSIEKNEKPVICAMIGRMETVVPKERGGIVFLGSVEEASEIAGAAFFLSRKPKVVGA